MDRFSIRLHGLGGQGLKSMIQDMLAPIILSAGFQVQAFPFFGGERRGAPVSGYLRCGQKKITTHSFIAKPDMIVFFDHERISVNNAIKDLRPSGIALINAAFPNQFLGLIRNWQIYALDARAISLEHEIGNPEDPYMIINSAMAGAILQILESIFGSQFPDKMIENALKNILPQKISENYAAFLDGKRNVVKLAVNASTMRQWTLEGRATPYLTQPDENCTKCNLCYLFCPKRAIEINDNVYVINEEKCNYCGICVTLCPRNAIALVIEEGTRYG